MTKCHISTPVAPGYLTKCHVLIKRCEQGNSPAEHVQTAFQCTILHTILLRVRCVMLLHFYQTISQELSMPQAIGGYVLKNETYCCRCKALNLQLQCCTVCGWRFRCMACSSNSWTEASTVLMSNSPTVQQLFGCETDAVSLSAGTVPAAAHVIPERIA